MEAVKKKKEYTVFKKRSGRYGVKDTKTKKWISGDDKVKILLAEKLIKVSPPKKKEEPKAEEPKAEEAKEPTEKTEAAAEEK